MTVCTLSLVMCVVLQDVTDDWCTRDIVRTTCTIIPDGNLRNLAGNMWSFFHNAQFLYTLMYMYL